MTLAIESKDWLPLINTFLTGIFSIATTIIASTWLKDYFKRKKKHDYAVGEYHSNEDKIINCLEDIKIDTKAFIVTLWGFQNGSYFTSEYGELKAKAMYQFPLPDPNKGIPDAIQDCKSVELWKFGRLFSKLQKCQVDDCSYNEEYKHRDYQRAAAEHLKMKSYHVFKIKDTRIKNCDKQWKHTLIIGFNDDVMLNSENYLFINSQIELLKKYLFQ